MFLEEYLISFKMYEDSEKYICFVRQGVCKIVVCVRCLGRVLAWSSLYRAKHVTRFKLVEGKISK